MTYLAPTFPDPAGYRAAATALRRQAEDLGYFAQRVDRTIAATSFEGPAADRFRSTMSDQRTAVLHLAGELHSYANAMSRTAASLEAQIAGGWG